MKKCISAIIAYILWINYFVASAQNEGNKRDSLSVGLKQIANIESTSTWIKFNNTVKINPETLFEDYKTAFGLSDADKMIVHKTFVDDIGFTIRNYQQFYKSIPIDGESVNVHTNKNGETFAATGKILKGINVETSPKLSPQEAIDLVLAFVNAKEYRWQNSFWENELKQKNTNADTTYYPKPFLVIKEEQGYSSGLGIFHLAYRMDIYTSSPFYSQRIYVDAFSGAIIEKYPLESN